MHTFTSAASFVLSATLSRPPTTFSIKVASELNTLFFPSHRHIHLYAYIYVAAYIYIHTYTYTTTYVLMRVRLSRRRKKKRTDPFTFIAIDPVYMCMYGRSSLLSSLFFPSQSPWTNRQAAAVADAALLNVINLGGATFVRLFVLYRKRSFFSFVTHGPFNNVQIRGFAREKACKRKFPWIRSTGISFEEEIGKFLPRNDIRQAKHQE